VWDAVEAVNTKGEYSIISGRINDIAWDGDSQRLIAVGDGRQRFGHCITADSGNSVGEITGHSKVINAVALRGQRPMRAATVSDDMAVCFLHGVPFKFNSKHSNVHKGFVFGAAFSPDGNHLVTVGADKKLQFYDGKTGEPTKKVGEGEHTGSIFAVSWAADSKKLVTASADQTVKIWDVESGKVTQSWRLGAEGVSIPDQQVGVVWPHGRSDGLIISLNLNGDLTYLHEGKPEPTRVIQGHNKSITAMGADSAGKGAKLFTGSFDGRVLTWDVSSGVGTVVDGQSHTTQIPQIASDSGRGYSVAWDDTLRIIDESASTFAGESVKISAQPKGVAAAEDRVFVATVAGVEVYVNGSLASKLDITDAQPTSISAHGSSVAVGLSNNATRVFKVDGSNNLAQSGEVKSSISQITAVSYSRNGSLLAAGDATGKIFVYKTADLSTATDRWSAHTARVTSISWNEAGTHAVSGALDTNVFVWSMAKPGSRVKAPNAHKDGVNAVSWLAGDKVASTGADASVKIWTTSGLQ
jgi:WD repeat-containing protein 1 (actin-interacting protein 1)